VRGADGGEERRQLGRRGRGRPPTPVACEPRPGAQPRAHAAQRDGGQQGRRGAGAAVVVTSAISAVWHVPFQLSGIQHIDGVSPVTLALTVPFAIFGVGLVIGSLWLKTESIWIVTLAHGRSTSGDSTPSSTWSSSGPRTRSWEAPVSSRLSSSGPCCCGWARGRASARPAQHERSGRPKSRPCRLTPELSRPAKRRRLE
jgi:hypothetical protein